MQEDNLTPVPLEPTPSSKPPKLSVLMVTYNHEAYIAKALESVFSQQHDYTFEIVVGDDASIDRTGQIVAEYSLKYAGVIRLIRHPQNIGHCRNYFAALEACRGEYVALLDGDDYWTDPLKLKKQIEFLEKNRDFTLSCHRYRRHYLQQNRYEEDLCPQLFEENPGGFVMDPDKFFTDWVAQTVTVVVRSSAVDITEFRNYKYFADVQLFYSVLKKGKGYAHGFFGAIYNLHGDGVWSSLNDYQRTQMNFRIVDELWRNYPHDLPLKRAYNLFRRSLLWMEYQQLKSGPRFLRARARIAWLGLQLFFMPPEKSRQR